MYYICIIEGVGGNKQFLVKVKFKQLLRNFEAEPQEIAVLCLRPAMILEMILHTLYSPSVRRYPCRISSAVGQQKLLRSCPQFQGGLIPPPNRLVFWFLWAARSGHCRGLLVENEFAWGKINDPSSGEMLFSFIPLNRSLISVFDTFLHWSFFLEKVNTIQLR